MCEAKQIFQDSLKKQFYQYIKNQDVALGQDINRPTSNRLAVSSSNSCPS